MWLQPLLWLSGSFVLADKYNDPTCAISTGRVVVSMLLQ